MTMTVILQGVLDDLTAGAGEAPAEQPACLAEGYAEAKGDLPDRKRDRPPPSICLRYTDLCIPLAPASRLAPSRPPQTRQMPIGHSNEEWIDTDSHLLLVWA